MSNKENSFIYQFLFTFKNYLIFELYYKNKKEFFNHISFFKSILLVIFWTKLRVIYYVNNWVYTTNHKRIAVNYFWFVILSGIVGMVLATLIRLEFAYPGVGVFAGDSIQYLSLATAHAVVMVFFMIMPLLFGAFANFLLPTQLGVHDVAFPRLNSAAFWFLPGGLLMLCQLVCVDRRYQRMNCFNIREIQSILKRKFFTDLINSHDHHTLLDKTAMGLRYKTNTINSINSNSCTFYNYGIEFTPKVRNNFFNDSLTNSSTSFFHLNSLNYTTILLFKNSTTFSIINDLFLSFFIKCTSFFTINCFKNTTYTLMTILLNFSENNFFSLFGNLESSFFNVFNSFIYYLSTPVFINNFITSPLKFLNILFKIICDFTNNIVFSYLQLFSAKTFNSVNYDRFATIHQLPNYTNFNLFSFMSLFVNNFNTNSLYAYASTAHLIFFPNFYINSSLYSLAAIRINNLINYDLSFSNTTVLSNKTSNSLIYGNIFKKSFFSNLDYSSRMVHFYFFVYFIVNIPFLIISFFKSIFDPKSYIFFLNKTYNFFLNWYFTFLIDNNLFEFIVNESQSNLFNLFKTASDLKILNFLNNFYLLIGSFSATPLNFLITTLNELALNEYLELFSDFIVSTKELLNTVIFNLSTFSLFVALINLTQINLSEKFSLITTNYLSYYSNYFTNTENNFLNKYNNEELSTDYRYSRFSNPVFKYDYKSGDYFPKLYKEVYTSLFTSINDLTGGLRTSPWFLSDKYKEAFETNFSNYTSTISKYVSSSTPSVHLSSVTKFSPTDGFYNLFYLISTDETVINKKWIALNSLNQKFYKMFNTSSMQQRVYSNWRQLKFTREAWRCKLLAARHQKTLFKRYVHEDGVFWSIERNAKDLLPGWAMITPFSSRTRFTAVGKTDIGLMGVLLVLNSSLISGANFLVTYRYLSTLNNRKMRDARAFFTEGIMVASWMMIAANPMLVIGIVMLLSDRHWQTSFFDYSGGGDTVLFQHMFWFFGHPEVYVIVIPTFGFTNTMLSYYLKKRVSARASLLYSMYTIAFLGFFVWGHHMYMVGLAHTTRMLFSTLTVMISVPAATKIMHWCVTTVNSSFATELPLLFIFTFIFFFVSGGISGMCVAHTGMDVLFHDTFYVIGHFHVMLAGSAMFASFGAFYFYFPAIFGVKFSRIYAYLHYCYYLLGQLMTVIPMFWLGYAGMPRRVLDYPASMGGWHSVISAGHMLSVAGLMAFFIMIFDSLRQGRAVIRNTFGISRYNTRVNFYLYEIARLTYVQQKSLTLFRFIKPTSVKLNKLHYCNFEPYETTLLTYTFLKK